MRVEFKDVGNDNISKWCLSQVYIYITDLLFHSLGVDEQSPNEDEYIAHSALQKTTGSKQRAGELEDCKCYYIVIPFTCSAHWSLPAEGDDDSVIDVVADHQQHNCKPRPPSADHLHRSAIYHRSWPRRIVETDDEQEIVPDSEEEVEDIPQNKDPQSDNSKPPRKRAKRNLIHHDARPTQLCFYAGAWVDILECAKQYFRLWLIKECPFADCKVNLPDAWRALNCAIEEFKAKDIEVEEGKWNTNDCPWS